MLYSGAEKTTTKEGMTVFEVCTHETLSELLVLHVFTTNPPTARAFPGQEQRPPEADGEAAIISFLQARQRGARGRESRGGPSHRKDSKTVKTPFIVLLA